jgi:hypothetical protein
MSVAAFTELLEDIDQFRSEMLAFSACRSWRAPGVRTWRSPLDSTWKGCWAAGSGHHAEGDIRCGHASSI